MPAQTLIKSADLCWCISAAMTDRYDQNYMKTYSYLQMIKFNKL